MQGELLGLDESRVLKLCQNSVKEYGMWWRDLSQKVPQHALPIW